MATKYSLDGNVTDENSVPVLGASVYVYDEKGELALLLDDLGQLVGNPVLTGEDGYWRVFVEDEGFYSIEYVWGGRKRLIEANRVAGRTPIQQVRDEADRAALERAQAELAADLAASGGSFFNTKADATASLGSIADNAYATVLADETKNGGRVVYQKTGGALVERADLSRLPQYTGELLSSGNSGSRYRASLGDYVDGGGKNNRADLIISRVSANWAANHGGSGAPYAYQDQTTAFGVNILGNGLLDNPQNSGAGWFFEPKFYQEGVFAYEVQLRFRGLDGIERRPLQWFLPEAGGTVRGKADAKFQVDRIKGHDWLDNQVFVWDLQTRVFGFLTGSELRFDGNNAPVLRQLNSAGTSFLPLPYIDENDAIRQDVPLSIVADVSKANLFANQAAIQAQSSGHVANSYQLRMTMTGTVDGEMFGYDFIGNATTYTQNMHNAKVGGRNIFYLTSSGGETSFVLGTAEVRWTVGVEPVSGEFRVCPENGALTGAQALRLSADGKVKAPGGIGVGNSAAASTLGTVVRKMEVFNIEGVSIGFVPIYDAVT